MHREIGNGTLNGTQFNGNKRKQLDFCECYKHKSSCFRFVLLHTDIFEIAQIWHILAMFTIQPVSVEISHKTKFNLVIKRPTDTFATES